MRISDWSSDVCSSDLAFAATRAGLSATIVVPEGNSVEKNAAMRAFGAELIVHGHDFQAALEHAVALADDRRLHMVQSFDPMLVEIGRASCRERVCQSV